MSYEKHAEQQTRLAEAAYKTWFAALPPDEQRRLEALGLDKPDQGAGNGAPDAGQGGADGADPAEWSSASYLPDLAAQLDQLPEQMAEQFSVSLACARLIVRWHLAEVDREAELRVSLHLNRAIGELLRPGNVRIRAGALALALNMGTLNGISCQSAFARENKVSRAYVSKEVRHLKEVLGLGKGRHMKSDAAVDRFRDDKLNNHWRGRKC